LEDCELSSIESGRALLSPLYKNLKKGARLSLSKDEKQRASERILYHLNSANEEPVQLVLIAVDTGISLAKVEFQPELEGDDSILSGFLTALKCMSDMIFSQPFDRMIFGKYTMLMRVEFPLLFCYVFRGSINHAVLRLDEFIRALQNKIPLLDSLKTTITTGAVDKIAKLSIEDIATHIFTDSGRLNRGVD